MLHEQYLVHVPVSHTNFNTYNDVLAIKRIARMEIPSYGMQISQGDLIEFIDEATGAAVHAKIKEWKGVKGSRKHPLRFSITVVPCGDYNRFDHRCRDDGWPTDPDEVYLDI